jgi:hypothetical protein
MGSYMKECKDKYQTLRVPGTMALFRNITHLWHPAEGRSHSISMRPRKRIKYFPAHVSHINSSHDNHPQLFRNEKDGPELYCYAQNNIHLDLQ